MIEELDEHSTVKADVEALRTNKLLAALPYPEFQHLLPTIQIAEFAFGECIYDVGATIDQVLFPIEGVISSMGLMEDGSTIEVSMVGKESLAGISALFGVTESKYWIGSIASGRAAMLDVRVLSDLFQQSTAAQRVLLKACHGLMTQISQRSICNARHSLIERLCCWLLMIDDRVGAGELRLTQESIASKLSLRRAGISGAAATLRTMKAVTYQRGVFQIANRKVLEQVACECYLVLGKEFDRPATVSFV